MKTIGRYLRDARKAKGLTIKGLAEITKIRENFLVAIEKGQWRALPEFSVVLGFVKSVAGALEMDRNQAAALLRRDYPPKMVVDSPKPEIKREFRISPQFTFFLGVGVVILAIFGYLVIQYISFVRPPKLIVNTPTENQTILDNELTVTGVTDPNTTVIVNTQPALIEDDGSFKTTIEINEDTSTVEVVATSRAGKETKVVRTIKPEIQNN
jgi:cytoskeletal protein RodZ